jgi:hypothetical protein
MTMFRNRAAKSVRRKLGLMLLGALALTSFGALAVFAAGGKADFSIAVSPSSQTVSQGQATSYSATVSKVNGFTGPVSLGVSGLPSGATASWKLSDGTSSNVIPPSLNSATLTINTASSTPTGTTQPIIAATSDKLSHTTAITLAVQSAVQPNFTLGAAPVSQTVVQSDQASYSLNVARTGGFNGAVSLAVAGLPKAATSSWSPGSTVSAGGASATLQIQTANNSQEGSYPLTITGTGTIGGSTVSRSASVMLIVEKNQGLQIAGNLAAQLAPGKSAKLNLSLTNPANSDVQITNLAVAIEESTSRASCSGTQNFKVTQVPAARYPITLPGNQTRTLSQLGVADSQMPQVEMLNQPWNQDACKNATITLNYSGSATK